MHHPTDRITYHSLCYTSRGALAGTRTSSMGPPHEGPIRRPIAPWADALPLCEVTECYKHTPPECPSRTWWRWGLRQYHRHAPCPAFSHWNININIYDTITLLVKTGMPNLNVLFNETITVYWYFNHQLLVIPYDKNHTRKDWNEWINECLTTPQHEKQIGYWVSEKGKCMKWLYH